MSEYIFEEEDSEVHNKRQLELIGFYDENNERKVEPCPDLLTTQQTLEKTHQRLRTENLRLKKEIQSVRTKVENKSCRVSEMQKRAIREQIIKDILTMLKPPGESESPMDLTYENFIAKLLKPIRNLSGKIRTILQPGWEQVWRISKPSIPERIDAHLPLVSDAECHAECHYTRLTINALQRDCNDLQVRIRKHAHDLEKWKRADGLGLCAVSEAKYRLIYDIIKQIPRRIRKKYESNKKKGIDKKISFGNFVLAATKRIVEFM